MAMKGAYSRNRRILFWALLIFVVLQIAFSGWFCYYTFGVTLQSDAASALLRSELIAQQGGWLFPEDWYVGPELLVIQNQMVMVPLFMMGLSYQQVLGVTVFILLACVAAAVFFVLRASDVAPDMSMLGALLILLPQTSFSYYLTVEPVYNLYLVLGLLSFGIIMKGLSGDCGIKMGILGFLMGFLNGVNGYRMIVFTVVPMVVFALVVSGYQHRKAVSSPLVFKKIVFRRWVPLVFSLGAVLGVAVYYGVLTPRYGSTHISQGIGTPAQFVAMVTQIPASLLAFIGLGSETGGTNYYVVSRATSMVLGAGMVAAVVYLLRKPIPAQKRLFVLFSFFMVSFTFVMLACLGQDSGVFVWRYALLGAFPIFFGLPLFLEDYGRKTVVGVLTLALVFFCFGFQNYQGYLSAQNTKNLYKLPSAVSFLVENDYSQGAATYWHAGVNTVKTNRKVYFKSIVNNETFHLYTWLAPISDHHIEPEFYMLTHAEYQERENQRFETPGKKVYEDSSFIIFSVRGEPTEQIDNNQPRSTHE